MISQITLDGVASYRAASTLATEKRVNLIYGLNGAGKSTLSDYLRSPSDHRFSKCSMVSDNAATCVVYNQSFVRDNFHFADQLKGIFSLSKENKVAEQRIASANRRISEVQLELTGKNVQRKSAETDMRNARQSAVDKVWQIKIDYTGGDRVLEYCLDGLKGQKDRLAAHLFAIPMSAKMPARSEADLRRDVERLGASAQTVSLLPSVAFEGSSLEAKEIWATPIVGNENSSVAGLIEAVGNADWVRAGLRFVRFQPGEAATECPFCQQLSVTQALAEGIRGYFDEAFSLATKEIERLHDAYSSAISALPPADTLTGTGFELPSEPSLDKLHRHVIDCVQRNLKQMSDKVGSPGLTANLASSMTAVNELKEGLDRINSRILDHNAKLANRDKTLEAIKVEFWSLMRWNYDQTISRMVKDAAQCEGRMQQLDADIARLLELEAQQRQIIASAQHETINVDEAVLSINRSLASLAINDFAITRHAQNLYRVTRPGQDDDAFTTLSEGEKMIISFLYFCELCNGRADAADTETQRIAVIDDPISSLSHIYVFNIGMMIKTFFFRAPRFQQVFVMTHSLYFFHELTELDREKRAQNQALFRLSKNSNGSTIRPMKYEEIQNDYHSYWSIVRDSAQPPALIANCMRNIIEYFFNFVRRKDLNNVFQMPELRALEHQAFCRYVNRESHSLGQNIFDIKEFEYDKFKQGLQLVFQATGYEDHYSQMMKD